MSLEEFRKKISQIDEKLVTLLDERIGLARKIGEIKHQKSLPIVDKVREKEVYDYISKINLNNPVTFFLLLNINIY